MATSHTECGAFRIRKKPNGLPRWWTDIDWWRLYRWANMVRAYYGSPVYLVGSSLRKRSPRDIDVRLELPDKDFTERFMDAKKWGCEGASGNWTEPRWKWSNECVKRTKEGWKHTQMNIDFQIYPKGYAKKHYGSLKKVRIDTR